MITQKIWTTRIPKMLCLGNWHGGLLHCRPVTIVGNQTTAFVRDTENSGVGLTPIVYPATLTFAQVRVHNRPAFTVVTKRPMAGSVDVNARNTIYFISHSRQAPTKTLPFAWISPQYLRKFSAHMLAPEDRTTSAELERLVLLRKPLLVRTTRNLPFVDGIQNSDELDQFLFEGDDVRRRPRFGGAPVGPTHDVFIGHSQLRVSHFASCYVMKPLRVLIGNEATTTHFVHVNYSAIQGARIHTQNGGFRRILPRGNMHVFRYMNSLGTLYGQRAGAPSPAEAMSRTLGFFPTDANICFAKPFPEPPTITQPELLVNLYAMSGNGLLAIQRQGFQSLGFRSTQFSLFQFLDLILNRTNPAAVLLRSYADRFNRLNPDQITDMLARPGHEVGTDRFCDSLAQCFSGVIMQQTFHRCDLAGLFRIGVRALPSHMATSTYHTRTPAINGNVERDDELPEVVGHPLTPSEMSWITRGGNTLTARTKNGWTMHETTGEPMRVPILTPTTNDNIFD